MKLECPVSKKCGGCQLSNMTYAEQLSYKQAKEIKLLGRFCHVNEIIGTEHPFYYRNKVQAAFGITRGGMIISGVYQSSTHNVVKVDSCKLEDKRADAVIVTIRNLLKSFKLTVFNDKTGDGFLRHVLVKVAQGTGEIMVVLVTGSPVFKSKKNFCDALLKAHPEITTIIQNVNNRFTSLVLGEQQTVLYGDGYITDRLMGKKFRISAKSFYQINYEGTKLLYGTAMEYAGLNGTQRVIDAYSGVGTIGIIASDNAKEVISVESNKDAVKDAIKNAKLNNIENISFVCADATEFLLGMAEENEKADVVIMDPPRAGSTVSFMKSVCKLAPAKVVYVSCNPETLARDLDFFVRNGYKVKKIQPVDMFPHTTHVETVVQLVRKNPDTHIDFEISLDEFDLTASEAKATYQEIKDYVLDKFALRVSSLYISQVKTKCGIIERENYNKGEGKSRVPQCPPEKEKAIINALKHFKMI